MSKERILIVDDSEMNRSILAEMLGDSYEILEAENGLQAIAILNEMHSSIDLVLLDMVMPQMGGLDVLKTIHQNHWIEDIPVIVVSAEQESVQVAEAYELGVTDFIARPFDSFIVRKRVVNTLLLYAKQKQLIAMVEEQLYQKEKYSNTMIDILSHIVEMRNGESGLHVLHVRAITDFLLRKLKLHTDQYALSEDTIRQISNASALHDIGKIAIDEKILNKPGRLTDEEFAIMKTHSAIGAKMLETETLDWNDSLVRTAYDVCRWHHERYDGKGYPDGLIGDAIPISAQVVSLADVYDALTSQRVYKPPYDHETAVRMILEGACGVFNPLLLECLQEHAEELQKMLKGNAIAKIGRTDIQGLTDSALSGRVGVSARTLRLLDYERMKNDFFSATSEEIQFEYTVSSHVLTLSSWGAKKLGVNQVIPDVLNDKRIQDVFGGINWRHIATMLSHTTPNQPELDFECKISCDGQFRWHRVILRAVWTMDDPPRCNGALGKAVDIHDTRMEMETLKQQASTDSLTGLLNLAGSKLQIEDRLAESPNSDFLMVIFDLDDFKTINDTYGNQYGNEMLTHIAHILTDSLRSDDISVRIGGDEFMLFLKCDTSQEQVVRRIFNKLSAPYNGHPVSVSMGVAKASHVGANYQAMFRAADQAMYFAKQNDKAHYRFYEDSMGSLQVPSRDLADETT